MAVVGCVPAIDEMFVWGNKSCGYIEYGCAAAKCDTISNQGTGHRHAAANNSAHGSAANAAPNPAANQQRNGNSKHGKARHWR